MNGGASRRTCAPPSESPRRYPPPAPQPDLRYFPHENSGGELHAGFTLKPCGWLNSGRESGSIPGRDQQVLASYTCFPPQGTAARIVNRAEVTAGPSSTT